MDGSNAPLLGRSPRPIVTMGCVGQRWTRQTAWTGRWKQDLGTGKFTLEQTCNRARFTPEDFAQSNRNLSSSFAADPLPSWEKKV